MNKEQIQDFLGIYIHQDKVDYEIIETFETDYFVRHLIKYSGSEADEIKAYLFIPTIEKIIGSVLVHHQHHGERHLGKSEVAGITGDPFQFFCPELAKEGVISLAPDSICFEDRRKNKTGIEPDSDPDKDWLQHYNEMCYRLLNGKSLIKKVIDDSSIGVSLLLQLSETIKDKIGILGHSYGGNTVIFHSPFDERIKYSCSSGAVCSYKTKFKFGTGIEMAEVIPGFAINYDVEDLLKLISPRELLIVSATEDIYSQDAKEVYLAIKPTYEESEANSSITHEPFQGKHGLDKQRFQFIVNWFKRKFEE